MTRLYLYTIFHANLQFSCIPEDQYPLIIDQCFWPVVELLEEFPALRLGFEFPSDTLEILEREDITLVAALRELWAQGRCEIVGSGYVQQIFPLIPAEVNARNLSLGNQGYQRLFGRQPLTAYLHEQTYASGLLRLYQEQGYQQLVADWDNTAAGQGYPADYRYRPQWAMGQDGSRMAVVWNSCIAFQKFQRYFSGEIDLEAYLDYLGSHYSEKESRAFPLYGNDWEVFDYRPGDSDRLYQRRSRFGRMPHPRRAGTPASESEEFSTEIGRFRSLLRRLAEDDRYAWATPSEVVALLPPEHEMRLESAEYPIPCKKQEKYNVTRWAVCGRDGVRLNTQCFQLLRRLRQVEALAGFLGMKGPQSSRRWRDLVFLWGSDFRTHTTDEKHLLFRNRMGHALGEAEKALGRLCREVKIEKDFALFNPHPHEWNGAPFAFTARFAPCKAYRPPGVRLDGREVEAQVEEAETFRDGSLRRARLVIRPQVGGGALAQGELVWGWDAGRSSLLQRTPRSGRVEILKEKGRIAGGAIETPAVRVRLSGARGGTLQELAFPQIDPRPLLVTLPHGYFSAIALSADWYTGGMIVLERSGRKVTDLVPASLWLPESDELFPIRIPVYCRVETPLGRLWKTLYIYRKEPRLDLHYHFRLEDLRSLSFRVGIATFNPEAFELESLCYSTVNGGYGPETFSLKGTRLAQDEAVSLGVSSHHCLGATEGWVDLSDSEKGVAVITNRSQIFSVPLLHFEEVDSSFFLRVYTSIGESDDTAEAFWRGHNEITVTYLGHCGGDMEAVHRQGALINGGLLAIFPDGV